MYILSIYNLVTRNKDIYCSHSDGWTVHSPVLSFSNEGNLSTNKICRLNLKFGFESFNDILNEYNLQSKHVLIKKHVRKQYEYVRFFEEFDRPVFIGINTAEEIPSGICIDFMVDQEACDIDYEHNCNSEKFKTFVTWDIKSFGHFEDVLNSLKNLLWEHPKDKLEDIAIQFIIELKKNESIGLLTANLKTLKTGLFTFVVKDETIELSLVDENDYYLL